MPRSVRKYSLEEIKAESQKTDIYLITSPSGKIYVGKTYRAKYTDKRPEMMGAKKRWIAHKNMAIYKHRIEKEEEGCRLLNQEILKYIDHLDDFKLEILEVCDRSQEKEYEKKWIAQLKSQHAVNPNGLNVFEGGNGGTIQPEETRQRKAESMILSHQNRTPDTYNKYRTDEYREYVSNCQKANRICLHHDNTTKLPYEIQFKYWKGTSENSDFQIGYHVTKPKTVAGKVTKIVTTSRAYTLKKLDEFFERALDKFCELYPDRSDEVQQLYGLVTDGKYELQQLEDNWYTPPSKKEGVEPKNRYKNKEFANSKKKFDSITTSHMYKKDHNGDTLPMSVSPYGRKTKTRFCEGYEVNFHPLLKRAKFNDNDLDVALKQAIEYALVVNDTNFLEKPLVTFDTHIYNLPVPREMIDAFIRVKNYTFNVFRPGQSDS